MQILIDGRLISDKETGISRYSEELLKIYINIFGKENITLIINNKLKKQYKGIKIVRTDLYPFSIVDFFKFHNFLKTISFDVYHSMFYSNSFIKLKDKTYITTVHDLMYKLIPNFFSNNSLINEFAKLYFDFIVKKSLKNSDFVIAISETTKKDIQKLYKQSSIVITEGVNELKIDDGNCDLELDEARIDRNGFFLYVGNNRPHKNIEFLKEAYLESKTTKKLIIVGHKGQSLKIKGKEIIYMGYINDYTLKYLYKNAAAFVFPSVYEGFGLPILEAINMDTIVLSSNAGALREFGEYNIYYFDPYKKSSLVELLNDIDNFAFDNTKKSILLNRYNWKEVERQIRDFYKDVFHV